MMKAPSSSSTIVPLLPIRTLVPQAPIANILDGALKDFESGNSPDGAAQREQRLMQAIAGQTGAQLLFEFGPGTHAAALMAGLDDQAHMVVTGQPQSGRMAIDRARCARLLTAQAIASTEVIRHVDGYHGRDTRLAFAPYIGECDLAVIGATHDSASVHCDSLTALHLVKPGGIVLWCDYGSAAGVTRCLNELYQTVPRLRTLRHIRQTNLCLWRRAE